RTRGRRNGPAVRRTGGRAAGQDSRRDRAAAAAGLHLQRREVPAPREPPAAVRRDRVLPAVPAPPARPPQTEGDPRYGRDGSADLARHDAVPRVAAQPGAPVPRDSRHRYLSSSRPAAEPQLEATDLG